jgi:DNA-binding NtrC family response regulator
MLDATDPNLLVVGGDSKRLQWLTHHITSYWPDAQVTTVPAEDSASLSRLIAERAPDGVILQADFADEGAAGMVLAHMTHMLQTQPALHCILLADNGSEMSAVRALKSGAKDYLPLARITRDQLLTAVTEACAKRRAAAQAAKSLNQSDAEGSGVDVPGYSIVKQIATSNFS